MYMPHTWQTSRLVVQDSQPHEIAALQEIYDNCSYIGQWTGFKSAEENPMQALLNGEDLPPEGVKEQFKLQSIYLRDSFKLIGYLAIYHGYPDQDALYIAVLAIHTQFQHNHYGKELMTQFAQETRELGLYSRLVLTVSIKNWPALRFWLNNGFNRILKFKGDPICTVKTFALLQLECKL